MEKCGLQHMRKRLIGNLSGGYQQRVSIAQSIVHEPRLVVFDEPTNGLDPNNMAAVRELVRDISRDRAVIMSTHILTEAQAVCDNINMIEQGQLIFSDTMDAFNHYLEPDTYIAKMAAPPALSALAALPGVEEVEAVYADTFRIRIDLTNNPSQSIIAKKRKRRMAVAGTGPGAPIIRPDFC